MEVDTQVLPLLPLERAVILPHMAVTLAVESSEANAALDAARAEEGMVLVVPKINGNYARVGTIAKIEDTGRLPNGSEVVVIRGISRAVIGAGVPGNGAALRVQVEPAPEGIPTTRARELAQHPALRVVEAVEDGVPGEEEGAEPIPDRPALVGEDQVLHPAVTVPGGAHDQAPPLEPVGEAGHVRGVAAHVARQLAHGDGPLEMQQGHRLTGRKLQLRRPAVQLVPDPAGDPEQQAGDLLGSRLRAGA